jgi:hypothetical protein
MRGESVLATIGTVPFSKNLRSRRSGAVEDIPWWALFVRSLTGMGLAFLCVAQGTEYILLGEAAG